MIKLLLSVALLFSLSSCLPIAEGEVPRGIRNNNPGNIVKSDINWEGEKECADTRFECFGRPEWGIRAMALILSSYYREHGIRNVADVLHRWMPPHENQTEKWVEYVRNSGRCTNGYIYSSDFIRRLVKIENGEVPYTREEIKNAIPDGLEKVSFKCQKE